MAESSILEDCDSSIQDEQTTIQSSCKLSKKAEKRLKKYQAIVQLKKLKRKEKKERRRARKREEKVCDCNDGDDEVGQSTEVLKGNTAHTEKGKETKRDRCRMIRTRLKNAMKDGLCICIDCGFEKNMDKKEICKLSQQLGRLYGSNRQAQKPFHVYFTNLDTEGTIYKECVRVNCGFEDYIIDKVENSHFDIFRKDEIVYLSPDSSNVLETLDPDKVYIIGGLVDESPQKNVTLSNADVNEIYTAHLPIAEYMEKTDGKFSYSKILAINQVFDILLTYHNTGDWREALLTGVPARKGYVLKEYETGNETETTILQYSKLTL
ncbi:tRNA methyltransferase 10 homolog B-like [Saccoglossus kowalevskii]|uniref:tRNA methyltransferase 10 homolog B n=1 Tax=Saccoglossus kowalevskii TaxID=10224 RepID=A0ABM0GMM7_SACKO|nr:PREDICTED: tRNA methyltransferase 10 homolog B-like [Saccoglossus kowalevskii]